MINATNETVQRELTPAGNHIARCYSMIHIGTIQEEYMGEPKMGNKVRITWELPNELRTFKEENGEQPMVISKEYTLSMHEKSNLRKDLESWRGKGFTEDEAKEFDITKLLGVPCMLSIIHKVSKSEKQYATITSIASIPKGMDAPDQVNQNFEFNFCDSFSEDNLESFPDFIKEKIKSSVEYIKLTNPNNENTAANIGGSSDTPAPEDDLPF